MLVSRMVSQFSSHPGYGYIWSRKPCILLLVRKSSVVRHLNSKICWPPRRQALRCRESKKPRTNLFFHFQDGSSLLNVWNRGQPESLFYVLLGLCLVSFILVCLCPNEVAFKALWSKFNGLACCWDGSIGLLSVHEQRSLQRAVLLRVIKLHCNFHFK